MFVTFLILLFCLSGIVLLQIYLSIKNKLWFGIILPLVTLAISVITVIVSEARAQPLAILDVLGTIAVPFFLINIPTLILIVVYLTFRPSPETDEEIELIDPESTPDALEPKILERELPEAVNATTDLNLPEAPQHPIAEPPTFHQPEEIKEETPV
jgi:hypothetical protein